MKPRNPTHTFVVLNEAKDAVQNVHILREPLPNTKTGELLDFMDDAAARLGVPKDRLIEVQGTHGQWDIDTSGAKPKAVRRPIKPPRVQSFPENDSANIALINKVKANTATQAEMLQLISNLGERVVKVNFIDAGAS